MVIANYIEEVRERIHRGEFTSEAAVSQGILLPTLQVLGWPVFNTRIVNPEFSIGGRRVDYALCHPASRPAVFVEVKKVGQSDGADRQLFEYAFHEGVPMAILTDGQEWSFYLPGEQGRYEERRVYKLDLLERNIDEAVNRLERYLQYDKVCSGEALKSARSDYQNVARIREIEAVLPKAWDVLLKEPDSLLLELLAEKTEDLCGYKPDLDMCSRFLTNSIKYSAAVPSMPAFQPSAQQPKIIAHEQYRQVPRNRTVDNFSFVFEGKTYKANSTREVVGKIIQLLADADTGFLDRFVARKHGKKRRYIAQEKMDL
ncbi:hypothetical protein [Nitrosomonas communis]|uniref:Type I restriction enzyme R protein N-terminal domain-containing protein n=1 Tax=Nitrosomonas communis TaxID=44574 RepID=A0A1I4UE38_9PROT|nr:hypothetical protein [Nitrosomonas communis]SFM87101.1 hypothetical protein SAMN05421863_106313 [Nitrosomonas communis]